MKIQAIIHTAEEGGYWAELPDLPGCITEVDSLEELTQNFSKADLARSEQQARQITTLAEAEAKKIKILAEGESQKIIALASAEAEKAARVGIAQAIAIEEQVLAYGGPQFQLIQQVMEHFTKAIEQSKVDVVPKISLGGGSGNNSILDSLLSTLLSDKLSNLLQTTENLNKPEKEEVKKIKAEIYEKLKSS